MHIIDLTHFETYAGLTANDPRGQWTTADLAQWCYSNTDSIINHQRISPDDWAERVDRADGEHIAFRLEYTDADNIEGWTYTRYDRNGDECSTGGNPITCTRELKRAMLDIIDWAEGRA